MVKNMEKSPQNRPLMRFLLKNVLIAAAVILVCLCVVYIWLRHYTEHGVEVEIPVVTALYPEEAKEQLRLQGLNMEVIDSTFSAKVPLGTIVEQTPPAYSRTKHGRTIYVVMNSRHRKQVMLPDLHDMSYRQAENILHQTGLTVKDILYGPSEYRDLVLDVLLDEQPLEPGSRLTEGTEVSLVVGSGIGTEMRIVPGLCGLTLLAARSLLLQEKLTIGTYHYDEEPTEENRTDYVIYNQSPVVGETLLEGSGIDVWLSTDLEKTITTVTQQTEEDFF